jgi:hypothetical protein
MMNRSEIRIKYKLFHNGNEVWKDYTERVPVRSQVREDCWRVRSPPDAQTTDFQKSGKTTKGNATDFHNSRFFCVVRFSVLFERRGVWKDFLCEQVWTKTVLQRASSLHVAR